MITQHISNVVFQFLFQFLIYAIAMILTTSHIISDAVETHDKNPAECDCAGCIILLITQEKLSMLF